MVVCRDWDALSVSGNMGTTLNRQLKGQIDEFLGGVKALPEEFASLIEAISETYDGFEEAHSRLERDLRLSSEGLAEARRDLEAEIAEHKGAEEALSALKQEYAALVEHTPEGIILVKRGEIIYANRKAADMFGYRGFDYEGKHIGDFLAGSLSEVLSDLSEPQRQELMENIAKATEGDSEPRRYELPVRREDGERVWIEANVSTVEYQGEPVRMAFMHEITERKQADQALRQSEVRFRTIFEKANDLIVYVDSEGKVLDVSSRVEAMIGRRREELVGVNFLELDIFPPEEGWRMVHGFMEAARAGDAERLIETQMLHRDGHPLPVEVSISPVADEDGHVGGFLGILRDISDRKRAEDKLQRSEKWFRALIENAPDGIAVVDVGGSARYVSPAFRRIFGWPEAEKIGSHFSDFLHPEELSRATQLFGELSQSPGEIRSLETRVVREDGSYCHVEATGCNLVQDPAVGGIVVNIRDVTDQKRVEESLEDYAAELARSNEDLEQFAYLASHDLQEPLRMVRSYLKLLQRRYEGKLGSDADDFIHYAVDGAARMQSLIQGLLSYSRVRTKGGEFNVVDCDAVLGRALANLQLVVEVSEAVVTHDPLPKVQGDELQLGQLFQNLLGNAIKFRGEVPPCVHISADIQGTDWVFSVQDNGIGIQEGDAERIFTIFQRLHREEEYPGTGIGLAMCRKIVERHGGGIWVESEAGCGATFHFTIPASEGDQE
jgi:PAS domain S-box-containing protein